MESTQLNLIALDCSNSSVRASLGVYTDGKIHMEPVYQVANDMVRVGGYDYWDILYIFREAKNGLKAAIAAAEGPIDGIGISTWGIDFALYDGDGFMLSNPLAYRNQIGAKVLDSLGEEKQNEMFRDTGILCNRINSVYMIAGMQRAMPGIVGSAKKLLMVPDIMHYLLTGVMRIEPSEFSTTQLMDSWTMDLSEPVLTRFGIPREWFSPFAEHGKAIGPLTAEIKEELGINYDIPVICVASHDTASAVVAVPSEENPFVFISSGTWSLIGTEIDKPLINDAVLEAGYTNEVGAMGTVTLLKNSTGLFIIQRLRKEYQAHIGREVSWDEIVELTKSYTREPMVFDVNDPAFFNPSSMSQALWSYLVQSGQYGGEIHWPALIQSVYNSLACSYALAVEELERVTQERYATVYVVGGGSQVDYLNQLCADVTGRTVVTGAQESTSLGSIGIQLRYYDPSLSLKDIRKVLSRSVKSRRFSPHDRQYGERLVGAYRRLAR